MALSMVTLTFSEQDAAADASAGDITITPTSVVTVAGQTVVSGEPVPVPLISGAASVQLVPCDTEGTSPPAGFWAYQITLPAQNPQLYLINYADGAEQRFDELTPVTAQTTYGPPAAAAGGTVSSVNGHTGAVDLSAADVGADAAGSAAAAQSAAEAASDPAGAASAAQSAAESFATAAVTTETTRAQNAETALAAAIPPLPLSIPNGGTGTATGAPQNEVFAGPSSGGTGAPSFRALVAGDLPAGAGGVPSLTFTYGSTGAVPSSGTHTAGAVATDQNSIPRICITSGSPGTWRRLYAQPWQFFTDDYGAKGDGVACLVTVSTSTATVTASTPVFTSTGVDGGKDIMICGAGGAIPGGPAIDTIATVTDSTHAVLTSGAPAGPDGSGLACVFSSDDRVAIDSCIQAALTYALAHSYFAQVIFSDKIYGLGTSLFQSEAGVSGATLTYNTQVRLPVPDTTGYGDKLEVQLLGAGEAGHCQFWESQSTNLPGTALVSYSTGPDSTPDPSYGQQSIVGGPSGGATGSGDTGFFNAKPVVRGFTLVQPGWSNSIGLDVAAMCECDFRITATVLAPSTSLGGGVNPYDAWISQSWWRDNKIAAGVRLPNQSNNAQITGEVCVQGLNAGVLTQADHVILSRLSTNSTDVVIKLGGGGGGQHGFTANINPENYNTGILTTGSASLVMCDILWDSETGAQNGGVDINDPDSQLTGRFVWNDVSRAAGGIAGVAAPTITGAANLRVQNTQLARQVYGAPAYTLGTAFQNPWWDDMTLTLAGGTVTGISIGPTSGALTSLGLTSGTFTLPSGWWLDIAGSVKPTTFIAVPG